MESLKLNNQNVNCREFADIVANAMIQGALCDKNLPGLICGFIWLKGSIRSDVSKIEITLSNHNIVQIADEIMGINLFSLSNEEICKAVDDYISAFNTNNSSNGNGVGLDVTLRLGDAI